jgi:hypothetical protein
VGLNHFNWSRNYVYRWVNGGWRFEEASNWMWSADTDGIWHIYPGNAEVRWLRSYVPSGSYSAVSQVNYDQNSIAPHWEQGLATGSGGWWCQS